MSKCVMCEKETNGFYDYENKRISVCFEHYEDGSFSDYLKENSIELYVVPKEDCRSCYGRGIVSGDWVDYGSTRVQLPETYCDCVMDQVPESYTGEIHIKYE